jgi:hypothetical protein
VLGEEEVPAMKWGAPDTEGLVKFLVEEKSFNEDRVRRAVERINSSRGKSNQGACNNGIAGHLLKKDACTADAGDTCLPTLVDVGQSLTMVSTHVGPNISHTANLPSGHMFPCMALQCHVPLYMVTCLPFSVCH